MGTGVKERPEEKTRKVAQDVYWVGVYMPEAKFSVNAFLLLGEEVVLIDTGAMPTGDAVLENINKYVDPQAIDHIVATHSCVDHVGGLSALLEAVGEVEIVGHPYLETMLGLYGYQTRFVPVVEGNNMRFGTRSLWFVPPMFLDSWDTLYVFEAENRILFSADTFCNSPKKWSLFADHDIRDEVKTFHSVKFPAISLGDKKRLREGGEALKKLGPRILAPGHGLLIRKDIPAYIDTLAEMV